jgi:hypothetical protein
VCGLSPTKGYLFLALSHTIRDTACPLALYILEITVTVIFSPVVIVIYINNLLLRKSLVNHETNKNTKKCYS